MMNLEVRNDEVKSPSRASKHICETVMNLRFGYLAYVPQNSHATFMLNKTVKAREMPNNFI